MASSQKASKNLMKIISDTKEDIDCLQGSLDKLCGFPPEEKTDARLLRSRIDEQSSLIRILKQKADSMLIHCQGLQKINTELEDKLDFEKKKSAGLEKRFMELADNHQEIIVFKDEYKRQNAQLRQENEQLRSENETLFSPKLQDNQAVIDKLTEEVRQLTEKQRTIENLHGKEIAAWQTKLTEQMATHQSKETSLLDELHGAQQQLKDAVNMCEELKLHLQEADNDHNLGETRMKEILTNLTKDKDKFLNLSIERGKIIKDKQEEIQQLETKWKEQKLRVKSKDRFIQDEATVNDNQKVKNLQCALDESIKIHEKLKQDFEAYRQHCSNLLKQEKELNIKLRHMIG